MADGLAMQLATARQRLAESRGALEEMRAEHSPQCHLQAQAAKELQVSLHSITFLVFQ